MSLKSAVVLIVSNACLEGKEEKCFKFLLEDLNSLGYQVKRFINIHEDKSSLAQEINVLTQNIDVIIVIGVLETGIIYEGVAEALSQTLIPNDKLARIINKVKGYYKKEEVSVPVSSNLLTNENTLYPVIDINRIFILNINCFEDLYYNILKQYLVQYRATPIYSKNILIQLNGQTKDNVLVYVSPEVNIKFIVENSTLICETTSSNFSEIVRFERHLKEASNIPYLGSIDTSRNDVIYNHAKDNVLETLQYMEESINTYGAENIFLSFNGGKDCTVLLHLFVNLLRLKHPKFNKKIYCLYVRSENAFPEQDSFIEDCKIYYNLEVITYCGSIKEALKQVLQEKPNFKACLMGTRRTDPYCANLKIFQMTDVNWPQIMRVSPILDWHYSNVWDYLLYYKVPYCKLYDMGYTSLGNSKNTIRNPYLRSASSGEEIYLPAYKMLNEVKERSGRNI